MKFTVSTKPLAESLNLGVIKQNVSTFYQKSVLAEVKADTKSLVINLEAEGIMSEIVIKGVGEDGDQSVILFVDCLKFRDLVSTFENPTTILEFNEDGLTVYNGKSKFVLEKLLDSSDLSLNHPAKEASGHAVEIKRENWKFIRDHQLYAISIAYIHPTYTKVFVNPQGDVIVGDFDNSIFTHSKKGQLDKQCLLPTTIINLLNVLPEGSTVVNNEDSYLARVETDSYSMWIQFKPRYESDSDMGDYNSQIILELLTPDKEKSVSLDKMALYKFITQSDLLATSTEATVDVTVDNGTITVVDDKVDCKAALKGNTDLSFNVKFKSLSLKALISNMDSDDINICPCYDEDTGAVNGILVWTENMEACLAGVDD